MSELLRPETVALRIREFGCRVGLSRSMMDSVEVSTWVDHLSDSLFVGLKTGVYTQSLAPEAFDVDFTRTVKVPLQRIYSRSLPASRSDRWKLAFGLSGVKWRTYSASTPPRMQSVSIRIKEKVALEREFAYPDSTYALPPGVWGKPVLFERWESIK